MEWLTELFSGRGFVFAAAILIGAVVVLLLIYALSGNEFISGAVFIIFYAVVFNPLMENYASELVSSYKYKLYEHYDEYEEYIEKIDDISAKDVSEIYPYQEESCVIKEIEKRAEDDSFLKLITINIDDKTSSILLWDQCAEYKEVTDNSVEESYYQLFKDDDKQIVILEKHIGTNEQNEKNREPKKIPQG